MTILVAHPYAERFPIIEGREFDALVEDIRENGLREPIVLFEGKILDGRNRYFALLHIDPKFDPKIAPKMFVEFDGDDPLEWVISKNLHRRHLKPSQRAMIAANLVQSALKKNDHTPGVGIVQAATMMNVAARTVARARTILKNNPTLAKEIESGAANVGEEEGRKTISVVMDNQEYDRCVAAAESERLAITTWMRKIILKHLKLPADPKKYTATKEEMNERNQEIIAAYRNGIRLTDLGRLYGLSLGRLSTIIGIKDGTNVR